MFASPLESCLSYTEGDADKIDAFIMIREAEIVFKIALRGMPSLSKFYFVINFLWLKTNFYVDNMFLTN